jgi:hypothetical protein
MRIILCSLLTFLVLNLNAQTKEEKWDKYKTSFQDALLDLVNNTSDTVKPISTASQAALDLKVNAAEVKTALGLPI